MTADQLMPLSRRIIEGLLDRKVSIVSYACDGTVVERSVQRLLTSNAGSTICYTIKNPRKRIGGSDLILRIPVIKGQAMSMVQDSKHALKTLRNNLFSGARLLVLGNYVAIYSNIRAIAFEENSPLYMRDVEKLDRQDDNAATRLFSSETLDFISKKHPECIGEIVYLFVFGELIDAYQNRSISHKERVKLVLRAHYFLESWIKFQQITNYPKAQYLISREALDIIQFIIEGYLSLVFIFRDLSSGLWALLPWLHSSEACEHVFGEARQIVEDFTMLDFIYMIPKLRVKMRQAILQQKTSVPKVRASGYNHTYFDMAGLDELNLATFPSDADIEVAAQEASEEADSLIRLLGLRPQQINQFSLKKNYITPVFLPSIDSWFSDFLDSGAKLNDEKSDNISITSIASGKVTDT